METPAPHPMEPNHQGVHVAELGSQDIQHKEPDGVAPAHTARGPQAAGGKAKRMCVCVLQVCYLCASLQVYILALMWPWLHSSAA